MLAQPIPATGRGSGHRYSLRDVVAAYGCDAVRTRITALQAAGCHRLAQVIERELDQLESPSSSRNICGTSDPVR
ncbi:hypothetical protein [Nocardia pseudobrasiliensis]|uniref:Uncharacterized protein n=1 Tax=Nocardia pseudobrasiliensis TaxID=45979 RepID=A0A370I5E0_9NOCA|nr:hypothetical protein [Nocardia pseudobrasiliensis]RDI65830.1 hypothetical protein DFR76_105146 [Nocardia pseudobrasiliensis]